MTGKALSIWTVYARPTDYPDAFVARRFEITSSKVTPTPEIVIARQLETVRKVMLTLGLTPLPREVGDDPKIVESWL